MKGYPTTQHPNERKTKFTFIPKHSIVRDAQGKPCAIKGNRKEPGVLVQYANGRKVFKLNSDYPKIQPLPYAK